MSIAVTSSATGGSGPSVRLSGPLSAATAISGFDAAVGLATGKSADTGNAPQRVTKLQASSGNQAAGEEIQSALDDVNHAVQKVAPGLEFSIDKQSGGTVIKVVDSQTKEVLRQIPGEEVLRIARAIDKMQGHLVRLTA